MAFGRPPGEIEFHRNPDRPSPETIRRAKQILDKKKLDIGSLDFDPKKVEMAEAYVKARRNESLEKNDPGQKEVQGLAYVFEAFIHDALERGEWFGPNVQTLPVAEYDDWKNGVDIMAEMPGDRGFSHLSLQIDVTYSADNISKKLGETARRVKGGSLGMVEFFHSDNMGFTGVLSNVPHVVVGLEKKSVVELVKYMDGKGNTTELKNDVRQFIVLEEIRLQLVGYIEYIKGITLLTGEKKQAMINKLEISLRQIDHIFESKRELYDQLFVSDKDYRSVLAEDPVYKAIVEGMKTYNPPKSKKR